MLIVNADDWGRTVEETNAALACYKEGTVTSVSAMVFMQDANRAATLALDHAMPVGLHLNFSQPFSASPTDERLKDYHVRIVRFLTRSKYACLAYRPDLREAFRYAFEAQLAEFLRLYGKAPTHFDGHQHMHLATNVLMQRLLPSGTKVRRSFSFQPGEKALLNRWYRSLVDRTLARRHQITDYFFSIAPRLAPEPLAPIINLARSATVELMTHPALPKEYHFLISDRFAELLGQVQVGSYEAVSNR